MMRKIFKKYLTNDKGLTLIELLVVIVILGIIAAIAVVSIGGIIGKTKEKAQVTEAVQIINGAKLAHSTDGKTSWTSTTAKPELVQYVSNLKDKEWEVSFDGSAYKIKGHDAAKVLNSSNTDESVITETSLTNYLGGN